MPGLLALFGCPAIAAGVDRLPEFVAGFRQLGSNFAVSNRRATGKQESQVAKCVSLLVKLGALVFILFVPTQYTIKLQLPGGIRIILTPPAVMPGAFTRWFNSWALLVGWVAGTFIGTRSWPSRHTSGRPTRSSWAAAPFPDMQRCTPWSL